jgi:hypothetical protein
VLKTSCGLNGKISHILVLGLGNTKSDFKILKLKFKL